MFYLVNIFMKQHMTATLARCSRDWRLEMGDTSLQRPTCFAYLPCQGFRMTLQFISVSYTCIMKDVWMINLKEGCRCESLEVHVIGTCQELQWHLTTGRNPYPPPFYTLCFPQNLQPLPRNVNMCFFYVWCVDVMVDGSWRKFDKALVNWLMVGPEIIKMFHRLEIEHSTFF